MDVETEAVALQLQLDDIEVLLQVATVKDEILSLQAAKEELELALARNHDRQLAERLDPGRQVDVEMIAQAAEELRGVARSYELIRRLEPRNAGIATPQSIRDNLDELEQNPRRRHRRNPTEDVISDLATILGGPSQCAACLDTREGLIRLPDCTDEYCNDCLRELFERSLKDTELFPPRCHKAEIPLELVQHLFTPDFIRAFLERRVELSTPNPTYCFVKTCAKFIHPDHIDGGIAQCPTCKARTCTHCKGEAHPDTRYCPQDPGVVKVLQMMRENRWQQCFNCKQIVDLALGCNHITCYCRAEFCFVCGLPWKTCRCDVWEERRLLLQAEQRVARRNGPNGNANAQHRAHQIQQQAMHILQHHECDHDREHVERRDRNDRRDAWNMTCEVCEDEMDIFIYHCNRCDTDLCRRCLVNR